MRHVKELLRKAIRACGYDVIRRRPLGTEALRDVRTLYGSSPLRTVLDVGANEGQTALEFVRHFPDARIFSFEPFPSQFERLRTATASHPAVTPLPLALGDRVGDAVLHLTQSSLTNSLLPPAEEAGRFLGSLMNPAGNAAIRLTTLDQFRRDNDLSRVDLLKLDTQGYEGQILEGARESFAAKAVSLVLTEVNFVPLYQRQAYFHEIYERLWAQNFRLVGLYNLEYRNTPYLGWCDALFVNEAALQRNRTLAP